MKGQTYEERLVEWRTFRDTLEEADDPIQDVIDFYNQVPRTTIHTDPWDQKTWPNPWELILENTYCDYCILLGICYTLQLTDRFKGSDFEIHIGVDEQKSTSNYILYVDDRVIGYDNNTHIAKQELSKTFKSQTQYSMPSNY